MSHPYYNPNFSSAFPGGTNMHMNNPEAQVPFISNAPPMNLYPQYPIAQPTMVQHVMVPVAVPVQPDGPPVVQNPGQFPQSAAPYNAPGRPREGRKRKSDELNYYLGNDRNRSRSRSADRYSDERDTRHSHSRNDDNYTRQTFPKAHKNRNYRRRSKSPVDDRDSVSPEGSRHSRHSLSYKYSDRSDRRQDSPGDSREYYRDSKEHSSRESRSDYRDVSRDRYRTDDIDKHNKHQYEDKYTSKSREGDRQGYHEFSDRNNRYIEHGNDRYDEHYDEDRRKHWNESKRILEGRSRSDEYDRQDYRDSKRRKHDYERSDWLDRGDKSVHSRGNYSDRHRDDRHERETQYDRNDKRESDDGIDYDRHDRYSDRIDEKRIERHRDYISDTHSNKSNSRLKIHVDTRGKWIETDKETSPVSDDEAGADWSRESDHLSNADISNDLNITIENDKVYQDRSSTVRDRPKFFEDGVEVTEPRIFEDGIEVTGSRRCDRVGDCRSDRGNKRSGHGRARLYEDGHSPRDDVDQRENSISRDHHSRSFDSRSRRDDFENVSESGSSRSGKYHSRNLSHDIEGGGHEYDRRDPILSRTPLPYHSQPQQREHSNPQKQHVDLSVGSYPVSDHPPIGVKPVYPKIDVDFEVPKLCFAYSSTSGCQNPKCTNWHVCKHFVQNKCFYTESCTKGHDFFIGGIYNALFEINNRKIDFKQKSLGDVKYKIIGKLREQIRQRAQARLEMEVKKPAAVEIDPEFDASNYNTIGDFIKSDDESETEKTAKSAEKCKESDPRGNTVVCSKESNETGQDQKSDKDMDTNEKGKTEENKKVDTSKHDETKQKDSGVYENKSGDFVKVCEKDAKIDRTESLSPVSVENIENWEEYERYEKVSEDGSEINIDKNDELENVSSDEEVQDNDIPLSHHNILAKAAIPIGMNDPLVFNPSKNAPPTALPDRPVGINEPVIFNVTRPPPPTIQVNTNSLFPAAHSMGLPVPNIARFPPPPLPGQLHPMMPVNAQQLARMPPPGPPVNQMPPQMPPINYMPSPSLLQEVIESLQSNQTKKEQVKTSRPKRKCPGDLESLAEKNPELNEVIQTPWQFPHKGILNMTVIDFVTETEAYKEEFVAELLRVLITLDLPYVTMKKLLLLIKEKMSINIKSEMDMKKILSIYPEYFLIIETVESDDEDDGTVKRNIKIKAKVSLGFCEKHGYIPFAAGKCSCNALHICKFYLLSSCSKQHCKFGHKLKTNHNMTVFRSHKLHRMTAKEVMAFIRDVDNRHVEMIPEVCRFYSRERGECYKGDSVDPEVICHKLHVCLFYAKGNCYKRPCPRSHCIRDKQPFALLQMYGLDPNVVGDEKIQQMLMDMTSEMERKKALRNAPCQSKKKDNDNADSKMGSGQELADNEQSKENETENEQDKSGIAQKLPNKVAHAVKNLNIKLPTVCKFYNNELGCKKRDWGPQGYCLFIHVCQHFVSGDCKFGDKCKRSHDLVSGQAGLLLQKHGLSTSEYSSREIADLLNNPAELLEQVALNIDSPPAKSVSDTKPIAGTSEQQARKASEKNEMVKRMSDILGRFQGGAGYQSYSVEDILEQIVERGKQEELMRKSEQIENSEKSETESAGDFNKTITKSDGKESSESKVKTATAEDDELIVLSDG